MKKNIVLTGLLMCVALFGCVSASPKKEKNEDKKMENKNVKITIHTSFGDMKAVLYDETPLHRDNFAKLVKESFYDSTLFHRVIETFMIQGGDPDSKMAAKGQSLGMGDVGYTVPAEFLPNKIHKKGALSAARMGDQMNPKKESSGCQFYVVQGQVYSPEQLDMFEGQMGVKFTPEQREIYTTIGGTPHLDGGYTVFGEVIEGLDVIDKIAAQRKDRADRPIEDIRMTITLDK